MQRNIPLNPNDLETISSFLKSFPELSTVDDRIINIQKGQELIKLTIDETGFIILEFSTDNSQEQVDYKVTFHASKTVVEYQRFDREEASYDSSFYSGSTCNYTFSHSFTILGNSIIEGVYEASDQNRISTIADVIRYVRAPLPSELKPEENIAFCSSFYLYKSKFQEYIKDKNSDIPGRYCFVLGNEFVWIQDFNKHGFTINFQGYTYEIGDAGSRSMKIMKITHKLYSREEVEVSIKENIINKAFHCSKEPEWKNGCKETRCTSRDLNDKERNMLLRTTVAKLELLLQLLKIEKIAILPVPIELKKLKLIKDYIENNPDIVPSPESKLFIDKAEIRINLFNTKSVPSQVAKIHASLNNLDNLTDEEVRALWQNIQSTVAGILRQPLTHYHNTKLTEFYANIVNDTLLMEPSDKDQLHSSLLHSGP